MENKNIPQNRQLFHFQLDLPDKPASSSKQTERTRAPENARTKNNLRTTAESGTTRRTTAESGTARRTAAEGSATRRTATEGSATRRAATGSNTMRRTSTAKHTNQISGTSIQRRRKNKNMKFSDIRRYDSFGEKLKFLLVFIVFYINVFITWLQHELAPEKMLAKEKVPAPPKTASAFSTLIFFPTAIFYMELVFHIYMKLGIKYIPIYLFFSIAAGFVCVLLTSFFSEKINRIIACILTGFLGFLFCVEIVCKTVLAQYYQIASSLSMAANNKLGDYTGAIFKGIFMNIIGILLMLLPFILLLTVLRKRIKFGQKPVAMSVLVIIGTIFFHMFGLLSLKLPYGGELKPDELYYNDTEIEEQVRQLGLLTMLRLDIKHSIFGVSRDLSINDADFDKLGSLAESTETTETTAPQEAAIDTSPNVLDLDFEALSAANSNESVQWLNEYFSSLTPTKKNEYTGMFKGYNVIFITAEGFSGYMIDKELTPTLYKLTHEGFVFNNFYTPLHYTSTSNGECQNLLGLYPKNGEPRTMGVVGSFPLDMPFTLCSQLDNLGYNSIGYHFNGDVYERRQSHTALGYEWNDSDQLELEKNQYGNNIWPQSDEYMVNQTFDLYVDRQPFNIYYLTISGHMPYTDGGNSMAVKNADLVADLPYSQATKDYIAANLELEKGLTTLINKLEAAGIADKTLLVMAPDHIPYFDLPILEEITGQKFGNSEDTQQLNEENINFDVYKNSLVIWSASMTEPVTVNKVCGQVDILPTLSNLLGLNYDSRLLEGTDIMSDSEGLVIFASRSWKSDKGFYNSYTGEFTPAEGVSMTDSEIDTYVDAMKTAVTYKLQATTLIQETNYYGLILPDGAPVNEEDIIPEGSMTLPSDISTGVGESGAVESTMTGTAESSTEVTGESTPAASGENENLNITDTTAITAG